MCPQQQCHGNGRVLGKGLTRWLPVIGAVGVAGYAYYDTAQVGTTALEMFAVKD